MPRYVRPIARHLIFPERFLLRGEDNRWYVWTGESAAAVPEEIAEGNAQWLQTRSWMVPLDECNAWVDVDDLPLAPAARPTRRP